MLELARKYADRERLATTRRRMADVMAGRETDYLPLEVRMDLPELRDLPRFTRAEQFANPDCSLYIQLFQAVGSLASRSDSLPSVRANTGTCNAMTVLGAGHWVPQDSLPCVNEPVSKEALAAFELPDDISDLGNMPIVIEHTQHHVDALAEAGLADVITVSHCDQQGPFDIACGARGSEFFLDLYTDPEFVHRLMDLSTDVYIAVSKLCKRLTGQPLDGGNATGIWSESGGVRMCGDSDILIGPEQFEEFVLPHEQRAFDAFGGGWLHYCGGVPGFSRPEGLHLHDLYARIDGLRGLNWTTAGEWELEIRKLLDLGVAHIGWMDRHDGEDLQSYFRRLQGCCDRRWGLIVYGFGLPFCAKSVDEAREIIDLWHVLQDELLPA
jgi:hypothetical protein